MKRILNRCGGSEEVKIRLRGKGSGHKEGPDRKEIDEPLHLCVSAKKLDIFRQVCNLVEELLKKTYIEYQQYMLEERGQDLPLFKVIRKEAISTLNK